MFAADNTALLLIDHQVGTMQLIKNIDRDLAAKQAITLAKMAKILGLPTVITSSQEDRAQGPILPEIAALLPEAHAARVKRPGVVNAWAYGHFRDAVIATGSRADMVDVAVARLSVSSWRTSQGELIEL